MHVPNILLIDHDAELRKAIRQSLAAEGYVVMEADAKAGLQSLDSVTFDLVLLDLEPPDMDGFDLVRRIRGMAGWAQKPLLGLSRPLSPAEQSAGREIGITEFVSKPADLPALVSAVRARIGAPRAEDQTPGRGRRVLVANDNPMLLKLLKLRLEQAGFQVVTAEDGAQALEAARRSPPDAILSDVLMPRLDGFRFCAATRGDPQLALVPVVLMSTAYTEAADRELALKVGASALAQGTPDCREAIRALLAAMEDGPAPLAAPPPPITEEYTYRVVRQLERQAGANASLAQSLAQRELELGILASLAAAFEKAPSLDEILDQLLYRCLEVAEFSAGAVYLLDARGRLVPRADLGFAGAGADFFGHAWLLERVLESNEPLVAPSYQAPREQTRGLLEKSSAEAVLILPISAGEERLGVMAMAATSAETGENWLPFAEALGGQVGQAIALARSVALLREKEEFLERTFETLAEGVVTLDRQGRVTSANSAAEQIFGLPRDALLGKTYEEAGIRAATLNTEAALAWHDSFFCPVRSGAAVRGVEQAIERPGSGRILVSASVSPLRDSGGAVVGTVVSLVDITERKEAEALGREKEELARSNAELGRFAYTVAHDLKAPIRTIAGFTQLLAARARAQLDEKSAQLIDRVLGAAGRAQRFIDGLLAYSKVGSRKPEVSPVDCEKVFQDSLADLHAAIEAAGADVVHQPLPSVKADALELGQLFQNLIGNALKFHGGQRPRVEVFAEQSGGEWTFSVRDNGIGIAPEHAQRIFQVFERLHNESEYSGSGIGLATCAKIVERHGGRIWVESQPGKGATFRFTIPTDRAEALTVEEHRRETADHPDC